MGFLSALVIALTFLVTAITLYYVWQTFQKSKNPLASKGVYTGLLSAVLFFVVGLGLSGSFGQIEAGHVGLQKRFGGYTGVVFQPGLYTTMPLITSVDVVDLRVQSNEVDATPVTGGAVQQQGQQSVPMKVVINYSLSNSPNQIIDLYNNNQANYWNNVMDPALAASIRAVVSQYNLTDLLAQRDKVQIEIADEFQKRLHTIKGTQAIQVQLVNIKDIQPSEAYKTAIEKKMVAFQETQTAQQVLQRITYETQQKVVAAQGQAKAQEYQARTITNDYLKLQQINNDLEVRKLAIERWNGSIVPFASNPFGNAPSGNGAGGATIFDARGLAALIPTTEAPAASNDATPAPQVTQ